MSVNIYDDNLDSLVCVANKRHVIKNSSGTTLTDRPALQFNDCTVEDDAVNGVTKITPNASVSGGHTIENSAGTDLTQRDTMQFAGYLKTVDDTTNEKTVVDDSPTPITWADWNNLTSAQKAGTKWLITLSSGDKVIAYGGDIICSINDGKILTSTLTAGSTSVTFTDAVIKTTSIIDIYCDVYGIAPTGVTVTNGQAVLTFNSQQSNASVKLWVR